MADGEAGIPAALSMLDDGVFVGRGPELAQLRALWHAASTGTPEVVLVAGEPGIGKTRLAAEFAKDAAAGGALILYGRCHEDLPMPYQALLSAVRPFIRTCPRATLEKLRRLPELSRVLPDVGELLPAATGAYRSAGRGDDRYLLFQAIAEVISVAAADQPVLIALDDLHWAVKPTLLLLRHLLRTAERTRVMYLLAYRNTDLDRSHPLADFLADLRRDGPVDRLVLTGFGLSAVEDLMTQLAGHELPPEGKALAAAVHAETGGNPFFIREVLNHLVDTGVLYYTGDRWTSDLTLDQLPLPEGVREVVTRRLSRLSAPTNDALSVAAVVGPSFSVDLLARVLEARDDDVLDAMDEAVRAGVVAEDGAEFMFTHALIRQCLEAELSSARRMRLHRRVAEALEATLEPGGDAEPLAFHFAEAALDGQVTKAADYALLAGKQAVDRLAFEQAVTVLERGLAVLDLGSGPDRTRRCQLLCALAEALELSGDVFGSKDAARRAASDARAVGSGELLAEAASRYLSWQYSSREDPWGPALCEEALAILGPSNVASRAVVLCRLSSYRALVEHRLEDAQRLAEEGLSIARSVGDRWVQSEALDACAMSLLGTPRFTEQVAYLDEALATGISHLSHSMRASTRLALGDAVGFISDVERLSRTAVERRSWFNMAMASAFESLHAVIEGRFDDAEALAAQTLERSTDDDAVLAAYAALQYAIHRERGRIKALLPALVQAVEDNPVVIAFRCGLIVANLEVGSTDEAREDFEELAANGFLSVPRDYTFAVSMCLLAETCTTLEARFATADLIGLLEPYQGTLAVTGWGAICVGAVDRYLAMLAAMDGRWADAEPAFERAIALEERVGARPLVARSRYWYARMLLRHGGDSSQARALLETAAQTAGALGMEMLASQIDSLLETI